MPSLLLSSFNALAHHLYGNASRAASSAHLAGSEHLRQQTLRDSKASSPAASTPLDIRTVYKIFKHLEPQTTTYACCPSITCCTLYPPQPGPKPGTSSYPLRCSSSKFTKICNELLVEKCTIVGGQAIPCPIKPYVYHHFHDHVAAMLSQPGVEKAIKKHMRETAFQDNLCDILGSKAVRELRDSQNRPFLRSEGNQLRLVWAICADWYNPHSNKAAGKSVSSGLLAMVCLSLPVHMRLLEEFVYLAGNIPGPQEPSVDAVNPFLKPLMHDLCVSYSPGVYLSRTYEYPMGRECQSAAVPEISDTPASKKITGHCSHSATYFCSHCRLTRSNLHDLNIAMWPQKLTREEHESYAKQWLDAASKSKQDSLVKKVGIRWSALLMLPYWQPSDWAVIDGMHVLLLGVTRRHCRDLLGLNVKDLPHDDAEDDKPISPEDMAHARAVFTTRELGKMRRLTVKLLKALCLEQHIHLPLPKKGRISKKQCIAALLVRRMYLNYFASTYSLPFIRAKNQSHSLIKSALRLLQTHVRRFLFAAFLTPRTTVTQLHQHLLHKFLWTGRVERQQIHLPHLLSHLQSFSPRRHSSLFKIRLSRRSDRNGRHISQKTLVRLSMGSLRQTNGEQLSNLTFPSPLYTFSATTDPLGPSTKITVFTRLSTSQWTWPWPCLGASLDERHPCMPNIICFI